VEADDVRHSEFARDGQRRHAGEPVVRMENVVGPECGDPRAELRHKVLVLPLGNGVRGSGRQQPQRHTRIELHRVGGCRIRTPRKDLHRVPESGKRTSLVPHHHVHPAGITRTRF
jgi:hypothetical protein